MDAREIAMPSRWVQNVTAEVRRILGADKRVVFAGSTRAYISLHNVVQEEIRILALCGHRDLASIDKAILETGLGNLEHSVRVVPGANAAKIVAEAIAIAIGQARYRYGLELLDEIAGKLDTLVDLRIPEIPPSSFTIRQENLRNILVEALEYQERKLAPWLDDRVDRLSIELRKALLREAERAAQEGFDIPPQEIWMGILRAMENLNLVDKIDDDRYVLRSDALKLYAQGIASIKERSSEPHNLDSSPSRRDIDPTEMLGDLDVELGIGGSNEMILSLQHSIGLAVDLPGGTEKHLGDKIDSNPLGRGDAPSDKITEYLDRAVGDDAPLFLRIRALNNLLQILTSEGLLNMQDYLESLRVLSAPGQEEIAVTGLDRKMRGAILQELPSTHAQRSHHSFKSRDFFGLKQYHTGDPIKNVHLSKTSARFARKLACDAPLSQNDIILKRFRPKASADYIIVLDTSGSMSGFKIHLARLVVAKIIDGLARRSDDRVGLIGFAAEAVTVWPPDTTKRHSGEMLRLLAALEAGGGTDIRLGLEKASQWLRRTRNRLKHIIVITDGRASDTDYTTILAKLNRAKITLSTVGIGDDADCSYLSFLARRGGGAHLQIREPAELDRVLRLDDYLCQSR